MEFTAKQIAEFLQGEVVGNELATVSTFAKIEEGVPGALSFLSNPKYTPYIYETLSSVVLVNSDFVPEKPVKATLVKVSNAYECIARLLSLYDSMKPVRKGISPLASISDKATIGQDVYIAPFVCIEDGAVIGNGTQLYPHVTVSQGVTIGEKCILYPNVTVYHGCQIGNRCILHSGCVIGADGFGFAPSANGYEKIPQIGAVRIEDDVEIGANSCVDRSTMGFTVVHKGVKIDNLVQIAHNVEIGENTVISSQSGVAGSAKVGSWCMFGGQTGVSGHITIGDRVNLCAKTGVLGSVKSGNTLMGIPAIDHRRYLRASAVHKQLPEIYKEFRELQKEVEELKSQLAKE